VLDAKIGWPDHQPFLHYGPVTQPHLVGVGAGAVAITHRPKLKLLPTMRSAGVTHLVTLLSKREGALVMGNAARAAGLEWIWIDLPNGQQPAPESNRNIVAALTTLVDLIRNGAHMVIHCSAGIHRTGMFTYALLRAHGLDRGEAMSTLTRLRAATAEGVGEQRLAWAEDWAAAARHRSPRHPMAAGAWPDTPTPTTNSSSPPAPSSPNWPRTNRPDQMPSSSTRAGCAIDDARDGQRQRRQCALVQGLDHLCR